MFGLGRERVTCEALGAMLAGVVEPAELGRVEANRAHAAELNLDAVLLLREQVVLDAFAVYQAVSSRIRDRSHHARVWKSFGPSFEASWKRVAPGDSIVAVLNERIPVYLGGAPGADKLLHIGGCFCVFCGAKPGAPMVMAAASRWSAVAKAVATSLDDILTRCRLV